MATIREVIETSILLCFHGSGFEIDSKKGKP
jgi:hypothetical protein